jgi:hypothetical protein
MASAIIEYSARLQVLSKGMPRLTGTSADFLAELIRLPDEYYHSNYKIPKEFGQIIDF